MKALYYRFLLLLLKPFWHLAISIGIILIVRIVFIEIVYADMDVHLYEKFQTGYYSEINPLGEVFVYNPVGELVGKFESTKEYRKAIDIPIEIKPYENKTAYELANPDVKTDSNAIEQIIRDEKKQALFEKRPVLSEKRQALSERADAHILKYLNEQKEITEQQEQELYYMNWEALVCDIYTIANNVQNQYELVSQCIDYVERVVPPEIFPQSKREFTDRNSTFTQYYKEFNAQFHPQNTKETIAKHLFATALTQHASVVANHEQLTSEETETMFIRILRTSYGDEINPYLENIGRLRPYAESSSLKPYWKCFTKR